jgi:hypothetical protein
MQQWLIEGMMADGRTTRAPLASKKKVTRIARVAFLILAEPLPVVRGGGEIAKD